MTSVQKTNNNSAISRAPENIRLQLNKLREEKATLDASVNRWDKAYNVASTIAYIFLAPVTMLSGCDKQKLPPQIEPEDFDTEQEETNNQAKETTENITFSKDLKIPLSALSAEAQNKSDQLLPYLAIGYLDPNWKFKKFLGKIQLLYLKPENFNPEDLGKMAWGTCGPNGRVYTQADVTGKSIGIITSPTDSNVYLEFEDWVIFPKIFVKGDKPNPLATTDNNDICNPLKFLTGEGAEYFYDTGLTVQSPYYFNPNFQWSTHVYADRDIVSQRYGTPEGIVQDPDISSMRWWAWSRDNSGVPPKMWVSWPIGANQPSLYNTISLISGATMEQKHNFFANPIEPESLPGWPPIPDAPTNGEVPQDGLTYFNVNRNSFNRNGFNIPGRAHAPLLYIAGDECHKTEETHIQFMIINNGWGNPSQSNNLNCKINFFQINKE